IPRIVLSVVSGRWLLSLAQPSFDGRNLLTLELSGDTAVSAAEIAGGSVSIRSRSGRPLALRLHIGTDSPPLTPLRRDKIFNDEFLRFIRRIDAERDSLDRQTGGRIDPELQNRYMLRSEHLERQLRSVELLSYKEKLMAGLPNYATYFGRDMMMSVLMMESILRPSVCAYVIESVLKKLSPEGKVSHEEALGGQAVRENAEEYSRTIEEYFRRIGPADAAVAESLLIHARALLGNLQRVRENYRMVDEDFQLSVLVDRFLSAPGIAAQEKRSFLFGQIDGRANLALILRNMLFVYRQAALFGLRQDATSLVSFHRDDDHGWISGSWRDSGAGYGGGRFAMDVNAIWVPEALKAMQDFFATLRTLGITRAKVDSLCPEVRSTPLERCCEDPSAFSPLIKAWGKAAQLFTVTIAPSDVRKRVQGKLSSLADDERRYWDSVLTHTKVPKEGVTFYALSLDSSGRPIPVVNSDPATALFLGDYSGGQRLLPGSPDVVKECVNPFVTPYPVGLFVAGIGPVIANDAYAKSDVWDGFRREEYHSPRVIWGREVNLFQLGMCRLIRSALSAKNAPLVRSLRESLKLVHDAVEASGLKHSELWSYRIDRGSVVPARYAESCDIQLWNLTDLAVQFELDRLPR
ncbi:MAG TPA: hypothetical protein VEO56_06200, partial [Bacteroidota bacterium]|nr:hypothetical protein [Bacteroidota bacterium]